MKGYKAFDQDLMCNDMQYEIGKEYTFDGEPIPCQQGFHFCKSIADCYSSFYERSDSTRICEIIASGDITTDDYVKYYTNKIKIVREVKNPRCKSNSSNTNSGYCNSGNGNSGTRNSGNWNSGDWNTGNCNFGKCNSGDCNSGNNNSGDWNSGNRNSGDCNVGNRNSGDWNFGDCNSGVFNTVINPKIKIFDIESDWTMIDWFGSEAYTVMAKCPCSYSKFIDEITMSDEEKENHPEYKTLGGYVKTIFATNEDKQEWWDALSSNERQAVYNLPNFDAEKFMKCTGITV